MRVAMVVWEDASELDELGWTTHEEEFVYSPVLCEQVGYVLYDGEEGLVLTQAINDNGQVAGRNQIPRGMIRSIVWLTGQHT